MQRNKSPKLGLDDLINQAHNLTSASDIVDHDLPFVHQDLNILSGTSQNRSAEPMLCAGSEVTDVFSSNISNRYIPKDTNVDRNTKATLLLGLKGKELPALQENVHSLNSKTKFEPATIHVEVDVDTYCKNMRENMMMTMIEDTKQKLITNGNAKAEEAIIQNWNNTKRGVLNFLKCSTKTDFEFPDEDTLVFQSTDLRQRSSLMKEEMIYAAQVYKYHEGGLTSYTKPDLVELCAEGALNMKNNHVIILWQMIKKLSNIDVPLELKMNTVEGRLSETFQTAFLKQAVNYLEESYLEFIYNQVSQDRLKAGVGGIPGVANVLKGYLSSSIGRTGVSHSLAYDTLHGDPVWPLIFTALRAGQLEFALEVANEASASLAEFIPLITEYSSNSRQLTTSTQVKSKIMYQNAIDTGCQDVYKRVCLAVISQSDSIDDHRKVIKNTEDYLWFKLNMINRSAASVTNQDQFKKLQVLLVEELGETYFNATQNPYLYFQVLFLSCQFEAAIEFLSRQNHTLCHGVHAALALHEHNMLLMPSSINTPLLTQEPTDPAPCKRLNLPHLVMKYTKKFERTDTREALQYFYFLRHLKTPSGESLFVVCLSELVIESNEYKLLLGYIDGNGVRHAGAIDKFQSDTLHIISAVAMANESKGNFEAAAELYDLAKQADKCMEMMLILMAPCVSHHSKPGSDRQRIENIAISLATRYKQRCMDSSEYITKSFHLLLDLMTFFNQYHDGHYQNALDTLMQLKLFPSDERDVMTNISLFKSLHGQVKNCIADVLLTYLNILNKLHAAEKQEHAQSTMGVSGSISLNVSTLDGSTTTLLFQRLAKAATMFAGNLPYHLPGDTCARLAQMQTSMS